MTTATQSREPRTERQVARQAIRILDGIIQIAENEMLQQGIYVGPVADEKLAEKGSICGGRKACLVGSLFLSAKHAGEIEPPPPRYPWLNAYQDLYDRWPMSSGDSRESFIADHPAMKLAWDTLSRLAVRDMIDEEFLAPSQTPDPYVNAEMFFEDFLGEDDYLTVRDEVITLCENAQKEIRREYRLR